MACAGHQGNLIKGQISMTGKNTELEHFYDDLQILEESPLSDEERLKSAVPALLSWFSGHARVLPWREEPSPYRVWLSEIMLQQSRVEAVKPYFERFLRELPDVAALAYAKEERLLKLWEGLGYYNRVRNLAKGARVVMESCGGEIPGDYDELLKLPGIGSYTAGAIASIAFGQKVPAVDGNVLRVISRVTASYEDITDQATKKRMENLLEKVMPEDAPGNFNQALMEVGATVCIPRGEPRCGECPFSTLCLSRRGGLTGEIPVKKAAKARRIEERTVFLIVSGSRVAVRKREEKGLLAGLYEFPNLPGYLDEEEVLNTVRSMITVPEGKDAAGKPFADGEEKETVGQIESVGGAVHVFSHVEWRMKGYLVRVPERSVNGLLMADRQELETVYAIPNAFRVYAEKIAESMEKDRN